MVQKPPISGPRATAIAPAAATRPYAAGRRAGGKFPATRATIAGRISAAPTPSRNDQPKSSTGRLWAIDVVNEPHPYTTQPIAKARFRPMSAPIFAPVIISAAITSVYAVIAPWIPVTVVPTSFATVAIDTFITELSSVIRNCPAARVSSTSVAPLARSDVVISAVVTRAIVSYGVDAVDGATLTASVCRARRAYTRMAKRTDTSALPRSPLNRDRVLEAALSLADDRGIEFLTMRKLGQALGVEAMSLYNHVANKDDILDGIVDRVAQEFELPSAAEDWEASIRKSAISAHDALQRHTWACGLMMSGARVIPARIRYMDSLLGCLRDAGFSAELTYTA